MVGTNCSLLGMSSDSILLSFRFPLVQAMHRVNHSRFLYKPCDRIKRAPWNRVDDSRHWVDSVKKQNFKRHVGNKLETSFSRELLQFTALCVIGNDIVGYIMPLYTTSGEYELAATSLWPRLLLCPFSTKTKSRWH